MTRATMVTVPFVLIGNKQALTDRQLLEQPWLRDFIARFPHCFERSDFVQCYYFFYREGVPEQDVRQ